MEEIEVPYYTIPLSLITGFLNRSCLLCCEPSTRSVSARHNAKYHGNNAIGAINSDDAYVSYDSLRSIKKPDGNRRQALGMLNPLRDNIEGTYQMGERTTPHL